MAEPGGLPSVGLHRVGHQEAGQVVWYSHLLKNFPQFNVIHIVKGFGIVNKAEIHGRNKRQRPRQRRHVKVGMSLPSGNKAPSPTKSLEEPVLIHLKHKFIPRDNLLQYGFNL